MSFVSEENFSKISEFIYRKSGIFLEHGKHYAKIETLVEKRASILNLENFRKYFFHLRFEDSDGHEFQEFMNGITVNETYFYREKNQFEVLSTYILPELNSLKRAGEPIRILSSPCSTGEEPYSIVLHILEEARVIEERDIEIVALDIDSTVIEKAKKGFFSERSVHAVPKNVLSSFFTRKSLGYQLNENLMGAVDFRVINVFDKSKMRALGKFDVIFSRNMLIYFDDSSRKEVAMTFYDMLNPGGYVMLGHAEYMSRIVSVFKAKKINDSLIYQR